MAYWLTIFMFITGSVIAQEVFSCAKVIYTCQTELMKGKVHDGQNTLHFDRETGLFIHDDYPKKSSYSEGSMVVHFTKADPEGLSVFTDLKERYLYYKSEYASHPQGDNFIFKEDLPKIDWVIGNSSKKIGDFNCLPAVGEFGGRTYDVWFTPDIPVSLGPYKLHGLPGMILEAVAQDAKVSYHFAGYESPCDVEIAPPTKGKLVSWEEFEKIVIAQLLRVEALPARGVITNNDPPADYEIERNKFTIISEYKRKREEKKGQRQ